MTKQPNKSEHIKKKAMLEALEKTLCVVSTACRISGIGRTTYYDWIKTDEDFKNSVDELQNVQFDYVESKLLDNIKNNKETSIIFYLKTKGKQRGYVERQEIDLKSNSEQISEIKINVIEKTRPTDN